MGRSLVAIKAGCGSRHAVCGKNGNIMYDTIGRDYDFPERNGIIGEFARDVRSLGVDDLFSKL